MLAIRGTGIYRVIYVKVDDELIISRMAGRRSCATCGSIYHIVSNPPRFADVCDKCSNSLHVRYDDKADIVRRRIQTYYELTNPIIDHYRKQGLVMQVSGVGDINEIADAITLNLLQ
ncbi:MAG: nucleoside monophosphate kinase [Defluviitaleaceae bacterium]|nr:nucleoside monophosphate kinase [Defluviitaleaceae bacterium]